MILLVCAALSACAPDRPMTDNAAAIATADDTSDAQAAVEVARAYLAHLRVGDYAAARQLWGADGAESGGDVAAFTKAFRSFSKFDGRVGEPTEIKLADGKQYIVVAATVDAVMRATGKPSLRTGTIMLRRSADAKASADERTWQIWGTDIRQR